MCMFLQPSTDYGSSFPKTTQMPSEQTLNSFATNRYMVFGDPFLGANIHTHTHTHKPPHIIRAKVSVALSEQCRTEENALSRLLRGRRTVRTRFSTSIHTAASKRKATKTLLWGDVGENEGWRSHQLVREHALRMSCCWWRVEQREPEFIQKVVKVVHGTVQQPSHCPQFSEEVLGVFAFMCVCVCVPYQARRQFMMHLGSLSIRPLWDKYRL